MKRMIRSSEDIKASDFNKSNVREAISIAEALKYVLDDMNDEEFNKLNKRSPQLYNALNDFITSK